MRQVSATVISNSQILSYPGARYFLMRVRAPEIARECKPGQFLMLKCGSDTLLRRPISIHSLVGTTDLDLLYAVPDNIDQNDSQVKLARKAEVRTSTGAGTRWLSRLTKGSVLDAVGPLGNGFKIESSANRLLLVAGGIGIAPLKFLADFALKQGKQVMLLHGARTKSGIFPSEMLPKSINLFVTTEDGSTGEKDVIANSVREYVDSADQVFACGPIAMYETLATQMKDWPVAKPVQVSLEVRMGCGTGICYSCSIKTTGGMKRVCKEGPVFNIKDIIWQEVRI